MNFDLQVLGQDGETESNVFLLQFLLSKRSLNIPVGRGGTCTKPSALGPVMAVVVGDHLLVLVSL